MELKISPCPRCNGFMEEGFIRDMSYAVVLPAEWVAGEPQASFWKGTKLSGLEHHVIRSFRCTKCGFLESYAL